MKISTKHLVSDFSAFTKMKRDFEDLEKEFEPKRTILHNLLLTLGSLHNNNNLTEEFSNSIEREIEMLKLKLEEFELKLKQREETLEGLCNINMVILHL